MPTLIAKHSLYQKPPRGCGDTRNDWKLESRTRSELLDEQLLLHGRCSRKKPHSSGWHELLVYRVVDSIRINQELNDDFTIDIPPGVHVRWGL